MHVRGYRFSVLGSRVQRGTSGFGTKLFIA